MALDKGIVGKRKAQNLARDGHVQRAIEEMRKILSETEVDPYDHVYLGDLLFRSGELAEAITSWRDAVLSYERVGLYRNAIAICKKVLRLDPTRHALRRILGDLLLREGLEGEAVPQFLEYLGALSGPPPASDEYLETLEKTAEMPALPAEAALRLSDHFRRLNRPERAVALLEDVAAQMEIAGIPDAAALLRLRIGELTGETAAGSARPCPATEVPPLDPGRELLGQLELQAETGTAGEAEDAPAPACLQGPAAPDMAETEPEPEPGAASISCAPSPEEAPAAPEAPAGESRTEFVVEHFPLPVPETAESPPEAAAAAPGWRARLAMGEEALAGERWSDAWAIFEQALHERPLDREVLPQLIQIAQRLEDRPAESHYLTLLGDSWIEDGEMQEALQAFLEVLRIDPEDQTARRRIARFREMGVPGTESVPEETHRSIAGVLATSEAHVSVAPPVSAIRSEEWVDLSALLEEFKSGVKNQIDEHDFRSHYDLALSHRAMGLFEEALEELDLVLGCPDLPASLDWPARELKGSCLVELNRAREAIHEFREALDKVDGDLPSRWSILYYLGCALESTEEWRQAEEIFHQLERESPSYRDAAERLRVCGERAERLEHPGKAA